MSLTDKEGSMDWPHIISPLPDFTCSPYNFGSGHSTFSPCKLSDKQNCFDSMSCPHGTDLLVSLQQHPETADTVVIQKYLVQTHSRQSRMSNIVPQWTQGFIYVFKIKAIRLVYLAFLPVFQHPLDQTMAGDASAMLLYKQLERSCFPFCRKVIKMS